MASVVQRFARISPDMPLQYEDQTATVQFGHFATKSVLGPHVTRVLDGTGTEAVPGISSLALSNAVRNAAAAGHMRRITRQTCGPTTSTVKQPPAMASGAGCEGVAPTSRIRASVEITPLLKQEVFEDRSQFAPLSAVLNNTKQTNSGAQLLYPYVRYLPNASKKHFLTARPKGQVGSDSRWYDVGNGFGVCLSDENKRMAMETHTKLDTPPKMGKAKHDLSVFFKGHSRRGGLAGGHGATTKAAVRNGAARRKAKNHLIGDDGFPGGPVSWTTCCATTSTPWRTSSIQRIL
jgi:hypothetical protein